MSEENLEAVRKAVAAFNREDLEGLAQVAHPDMILDWSQSIGPQKGLYHGVDGALEWMHALLEAFDEFEIGPAELIDAEERVLVRARTKGKGRGSGVEIDAEVVVLFELSAGRVSRMTLYQDEQEAREAAGLT